MSIWSLGQGDGKTFGTPDTPLEVLVREGRYTAPMTSDPNDPTYCDPTVSWVKPLEDEAPEPPKRTLEDAFREANALTDLA